MTPTKNADGHTFKELYDAAADKATKRVREMTHATHAQELKWANKDVAERRAATALHYPDQDTSHQWPLDPSASPSRSNVEFYQSRGE